MRREDEERRPCAPAADPPAAFSRLKRVEETRLPLSRIAEGMITHSLRVPPRQVVFVKGVLEASEGVAGVFAESGGDLSFVVPSSREADLVAILADLREEIA